jgi:hypothetical protein
MIVAMEVGSFQGAAKLVETTVEERHDIISKAAEEIALMILLNLPLEVAKNCRLVCKNWKRLLDDAQIKTKATIELIDREYKKIYGSQVIKMLGGPDVFRQLPELTSIKLSQNLFMNGALKVEDVSARIMRGIWNCRPFMTCKYKFKDGEEEQINVVYLIRWTEMLGVRRPSWNVAKAISYTKSPINPLDFMEAKTKNWEDLTHLVKNGQLEKDGVLFQLVD